MSIFEDFEKAADWFHRNAGRLDYEGETFTLTVRGVTSSLLGYQPTDLDSYYRAFVEACNEILSRLGTPD
jgi:hypothetical protein